MGHACCCTEERHDFGQGQGLAPIPRINEELLFQDARFQDEFLDKYQLVRPCLSSHIGQSEAFIFRLNDTSAETDRHP